ncbi:MAG: O-antigen ligase family protein, partial [Candidatus Sumerlaeia bacterium]|nr:O-antigen ligase family protein [Candidatus Sumerlaeia bacterium]
MKPKRKHRINEADEKLPSISILVGFLIFCLSVAFVIFGLTAYTFNLDDIKIPGLYIGGGLSLLAWAVLWVRGEVSNPPRVIWIPYVSYLVACLLSILAGAPYVKWVGWEFLGFYISCFGLVLLGSGVVVNRRMLELSLKFWVLITFSTTTFGLIHYAGLLEPIYNLFYPEPPRQTDRLHDLIFTFMRNRSMLSTILNVQFFGVFLLMVLPVSAATLVIVFQNMRRRMTTGDSITRPVVWMIICGLSIVFSIACIFTTYSKSALTFLPLSILGFLIGLFLITRVRQVPHLGVMAILGVIMAGTILFFTMGDLRRNFANLDDSMGPRNFIYSGAVAIFKDQPILGAGPGSFRIVFPEYRNPDYHMVRISNVTLYAHNWVLDLLAETGLAGTLTYIAFLGGIFWLGFRTMRESE